MLTLQSLVELLPHSHLYPGPDASLQAAVVAVCADSRQVNTGALFVATIGAQHDGHRYVAAAIARGAVAVVGEYDWSRLQQVADVQPGSFIYLQVSDSRYALALVSAALHAFPARQLAVVGVTGTDGKTTTSSILESILRVATQTSAEPAGSVGVITTVGARMRGIDSETGLHVTTPDAPEVQRFLQEMVAAGCRYAVIESTSHGLHQQRVAAVDFDLAVVTNITHEHLDYHGTREAYVAAKALLFRALFASPPKPGVPRAAVLNADDPGSYTALRTVLDEEMARHRQQLPVFCYGLSGRTPGVGLDVTVSDVRFQPEATHFVLNGWKEKFAIESPLIGEFNVYNVAAAATAAMALGISPSAIQRGVATLAPVLGRMQRIDAGQSFLALVDFAHTPVSLERALTTLRTLVNGQAGGRLIAVFGSAGLRDRAKRFLMGEISGRLADYTLITAEDPRTEDLAEICREIERGLLSSASQSCYQIIPDRSTAIQSAVDMAQPGDVVAAFGKGHERSMCFGEQETPWSDQETMLAALERRQRRERPFSTDL